MRFYSIFQILNERSGLFQKVNYQKFQIQMKHYGSFTKRQKQIFLQCTWLIESIGLEHLANLNRLLLVYCYIKISIGCQLHIFVKKKKIITKLHDFGKCLHWLLVKLVLFFLYQNCSTLLIKYLFSLLSAAEQEKLMATR